MNTRVLVLSVLFVWIDEKSFCVIRFVREDTACCIALSVLKIHIQRSLDI